MENREIAFDITLTRKDLFRFNLYYNYHRFQTYVFTLLGILVIGIAIYGAKTTDISATLLYIFAGILLIGYTPVNLYLVSKLQTRPNMPLARTMTYKVNESGIDVDFKEHEEGDEEVGNTATHLNFNEIMKIADTKKAFYVYTSPKAATILPKEQLGENVTILKNYFDEKGPKKYGI
ncbi:MAG: YcxB family protein [Lachnospiraceae bacterium]|nr:YcxB family protein [Lachnospiraceae bacterium]MBR4795634.1 YcxB family protein [Lachnospiraceae bacterium]MBR5789171.1 YcxB family protein [Lachnospiraceae bacterium]